jgi:hypothetical protein
MEVTSEGPPSTNVRLNNKESIRSEIGQVVWIQANYSQLCASDLNQIRPLDQNLEAFGWIWRSLIGSPYS